MGRSGLALRCTLQSYETAGKAVAQGRSAVQGHARTAAPLHTAARSPARPPAVPPPTAPPPRHPPPQGVCVAAYGADEFPAFFTRRSGCRAPARVDTPQQAAAMIAASQRLALGGGMVLGVPIPEEHAAAGAAVEAAIARALQEAEQQGVQGSEVTPFLLRRIRELTGGTSLQANIALVKHNAAVGAQVAAALAALQRQRTA